MPTVDAIKRVKKAAKEAKNNKQYAALIKVNEKNVFNSVPWKGLTLENNKTKALILTGGYTLKNITVKVRSVNIEIRRAIKYLQARIEAQAVKVTNVLSILMPRTR